MTPPPCNCAGNQTVVVWARGDKTPQQHDRCIHQTGPHTMTETCAWRTPKTEGVPG